VPKAEGEAVVTKVALSEGRIEEIQTKIDGEIAIRKARVNPTGATRPGVLSCLENLSHIRLIAAIIDEPVDEVEAFVQYKTLEQLKKKLSSLLKRAMSLPVRPGLEDEFQRVLAINLDSDHPEWASGARTVEALLEIAEALAAGENSEQVASICARVSTNMTPQTMSILFGWLENYVQEGKEFVGWLKWYREEQRRLAEKE
jgi:hypothetical protein